MAMTKKDFELIARVIKTNVDDHSFLDQDREVGTLREIADDFVAELRKDNPRFDSARFLRACGF